MFQWQCCTTQKGKVGQAIRDHGKLGIAVHVFIRYADKVDQRAARFTYCGEIDFGSWTTRSRSRLYGSFDIEFPISCPDNSRWIETVPAK
jgi:hypothetical protein